MMSSTRPDNDHPILVVDDEQATREALSLLLANEGYPTVCAGNGREALDLLRSGTPPCLIVLDLIMPVMDGWAFLSEQQLDPELRAIPVVVVTARAPLPGDAKLPVVETLRKPLDIDRFLNTVNTYC
jgi:CheY-like chemotaxis protein